MTAQAAVQEALLERLNSHGDISNSNHFKMGPNSEPVDDKILKAILDSLAGRNIISYERFEEEVCTLTEQGLTVAESGSPEAKVFAAIPADGIAILELQRSVGEDIAKSGSGKALQNKWITKTTDGKFMRCVDTISDDIKEDLNKIKQKVKLSETTIKNLIKRKMIRTSKAFYFSIKKGPDFTLKLEKIETDITSQMIASGSWKSSKFKKYNFDAIGLDCNGGHLHPLMKVRQEFRLIFLEMGFQEMPTNRFVESSFWNFDALFQPQQHPARDMHDTFFLKDPSTTDRYPREYMEKVKKVHSEGGNGSLGYGYNWLESEAQKLLLRTHTTAVSSHMLYQLAQQPEFKPAKLFSIDRVFRNETLDATHLAEFHQVEGVIADYDITLGNLIGFMEVFFKKMGVENIRFKPAYNPYTEPSMEIFSYHAGLDKWVEVGNSGMFRPEMLLPMGFPPNVRVIAWGLSLERPTMIKYGIKNIRELVGHSVNLNMIRNNPVVRFDKQMAETTKS